MENTLISLKIHDFDCPVATIDELVGVKATESWIKGDLIPNRDGKVRRKQSSWILKNLELNNQSVDKQISHLMKCINVRELQELSDKYLCELSVVIKTKNINVGLNLDKKGIALLYSLGLELDVDIYLLT